jgi:DNA-binding transcriptional ArsR family regulator
MDQGHRLADECAEQLKVLGEPLRLRILDCLRSGPRHVGELAEALDVSLTGVSHHLGILHHAGFVQRRKQGRFAQYALAGSVLQRSRQRGDSLDLGCCQLQWPKDGFAAPCDSPHAIGRGD